GRPGSHGRGLVGLPRLLGMFDNRARGACGRRIAAPLAGDVTGAAAGWTRDRGRRGARAPRAVVRTALFRLLRRGHVSCTVAGAVPALSDADGALYGAVRGRGDDVDCKGVPSAARAGASRGVR